MKVGSIEKVSNRDWKIFLERRKFKGHNNEKQEPRVSPRSCVLLDILSRSM